MRASPASAKNSARSRAAISRRSSSGRSLVTNPRVLILHEPTRGIDVGAKAEIYGILRGIASEGVAILLISSEIPELIMNAERVLVMRGGRISGELRGEAINETEILGRAMAS